VSEYQGQDQRRRPRREVICPDPACKFDDSIQEMRDDLHRHIDARTKELEDMIASGFPNGDPRSHRAVHEGYIKQAEDRAALRKTVVERTVTGVVWAGIVFVSLAILEYIKGVFRS
jgi:hypothetical protein